MAGPGPDWVSLRDYLSHLADQRWVAHGFVHEHEQRELVNSRKVIDNRLEALNDVRLRFLPREVYEREHQGLETKLEDLGLDKQRQIDDLKRSRSIFIGVGLVLVPLSGLIGAAIVKAFS